MSIPSDRNPEESKDDPEEVQPDVRHPLVPDSHPLTAPRQGSDSSIHSLSHVPEEYGVFERVFSRLVQLFRVNLRTLLYYRDAILHVERLASLFQDVVANVLHLNTRFPLGEERFSFEGTALENLECGDFDYNEDTILLLDLTKGGMLLLLVALASFVDHVETSRAHWPRYFEEGRITIQELGELVSVFSPSGIGYDEGSRSLLLEDPNSSDQDVE